MLGTGSTNITEDFGVFAFVEYGKKVGTCWYAQGSAVGLAVEGVALQHTSLRWKVDGNQCGVRRGKRNLVDCDERQTQRSRD